MSLQKILITGASSGLGELLSKKLAGTANHLILLGRDKGRLNNLRLELQDQCGKINCFAVDFSHNSDLDTLFNSGALDNLSVVINSAADFGPTKNILETSEEEIKLAFQVNVLTPFALSKKVLPDMIRKRYGRIINIGSTGGLGGYSLRTPYCLSKSALIAFSKTLNSEIGAGEYGPGLDIKCFCVCPGPIKGERLDRQVRARARYKNVPSHEMEKRFTSISGRLLESVEVVDKIMELLRPHCREGGVVLFDK